MGMCVCKRPEFFLNNQNIFLKSTFMSELFIVANGFIIPTQQYYRGPQALD